MRSANRTAIATILAATLVTGCSSLSAVPPEAASLPEQSPAAWSYTQQEAKEVAQLSDLIAIPALQQMIDTGLAANPGLQQTALALQISQRQINVSRGAQLPGASASFGHNNGESTQTGYSSQINVSWELDLWRKLSDQTRAAEYSAAVSAANYQAARDLLTANIMRNWLEQSYYAQRESIEQQRLQTLESNEKVILSRYRAGLNQLQTLDTARSSTASSRANLVALSESRARSGRALRELLGQDSGEYNLADSLLPEVLEPLASLPAQDLARRPDLQAAYRNTLAKQYEAQVAYKDLLPSISLSAALNDAAESPTDALLTSPAWSLLNQVTAPLFQGGRLRAQADIAELSAEQAYWAYRETLLGAVTEVDNALGQEQSLARQQDNLRISLHSARRSAENYAEKYRRGLVDILDLLTVQQLAFDIQAQLTETTYNRLRNRIDLGLALGLGEPMREPMREQQGVTL
ncbi:TolC family protein [Microbulbifer agarilyticus]